MNTAAMVIGMYSGWELMAFMFMDADAIALSLDSAPYISRAEMYAEAETQSEFTNLKFYQIHPETEC